VLWVSSFAAQNCRGMSTLWITSGAVLPPSPAVAWSPALRPLGWVSCLDVNPLPIALSPPDPPPRSS
jgi:hypothetical protein